MTDQWLEERQHKQLTDKGWQLHAESGMWTPSNLAVRCVDIETALDMQRYADWWVSDYRKKQTIRVRLARVLRKLAGRLDGKVY